MAGSAIKLNALKPLMEPLGETEKMPVLFLGHGSPMNAIDENEFVAGFRTIGKTIPKPNAILCVSAHWETRGTYVTALEKTQELLTKTQVGLDDKWGLDHGCWSVVKHLYPNADVPVIQLSLDRYQTPQYHYDLAKELAALREKGILIIGSGNMVHNLGMVAWDKMNEDDYGYDWAIEASGKMKKYILSGDHQSLIHYQTQGKAFNLAIPTPEHYLPLLYTLALHEQNEEISLFNDKAIAGSLTMTSVKIG